MYSSASIYQWLTFLGTQWIKINKKWNDKAIVKIIEISAKWNDKADRCLTTGYLGKTGMIYKYRFR